MKKKDLFFFTIVWVLAFSLTITWLVYASNTSSLANADQPALEMELNEMGTAFEVNRDEHGFLWVSDYEANEIWQVNPAGGVYTIYHGISSPSDARSDGSGGVWWGEGEGNRLGRLSTTSLEKTLWDVPGVDGLFGTQIDQDGHFWATGFYDPLLLSFEPSSTQLCTYTIPADFPSDYLAAGAGGIWLGSGDGNYIFKLDPDLNQFTQWKVSEGGYLEGLAIDEVGNLWWADAYLGYLAFLQPGFDKLTTYEVPLGGIPEMIALSGDNVWFTDDVNSTVGQLNPGSAASETKAVTRSTQPVTPTCSVLGSGATSAVGVTTDVISFTQDIYTDVYDSGGWELYALPEYGIPWGIATDELNTWFVDYGRQVFARISHRVSVTACKLEDADGDLGTSDDQMPLEQWTVYLSIDGLRQSPGKATGTSGCYTWFDMEPGHNYGVEEDLPSGWEALTATSYDFGTGNLGDRFTFTFINTKSEQDNKIYAPMIMR